MRIMSMGGALGARVEGIDLAEPLEQSAAGMISEALGEHGVLYFPRQNLDSPALKRFSAHFGTLEVNEDGGHQEPGHPEVIVLSNIVENGKPIGLAYAGRSWHTDSSYSRIVAFANVLYAIKVPRRDGKPLGATEFANMHRAYEDLPEDIKARLNGRTALHDIEKFWEMMRREKGSKRPPLPPELRRAKPPVSHSVFLTHPITGRKVLYANPGYTVCINDMPEAESEELLTFLFAHQLDPKYQYRHEWSEGDVLMWDNLGTLHNAIADYRRDEPRLIKRCQVLADRVFGLAASSPPR